MKIVDVCEFYSPKGGGVRTYVERKLAAGAAAGHEIVIIVPAAETRVEERPGGGRLMFVEAPALPVDRRYHMFWDPAPVHALLDAERPDMVEASSPWRGAWLAGDWKGDAPRALVMHADPLAAYAYRWFGAIASRPTIDRHFDWFWRYLRRLNARFDYTVCASAGLAQRLSDGGLQGVVTNPLGVDPGLFSPTLRDAELRRSLLARCGLDADATLLLGVGRHSAEKRWPTVVDACLAAGRDRPIGLVLIGGGRHSEKLIKHIGGNPHVHLLAPIEDRPRLAAAMASADVLIHGCEAETFGLVPAEALASGLPLVLPDAGGAADFADPRFAELYRAGDARDAAAALARLLDRDQQALHAATRQAAAEVRTLDDHMDDLFALYARGRMLEYAAA